MLLLYYYQAQAQKIHVTDTANTWTFLCISDPTPPYTIYTKQVRYDSTTVYNSQHYSVFSSTQSSTLIREDSLAGKVYVRNQTWDTSEHLLYNYSLSVNDTFFSRYPGNSNPVTIYSIVTQLDSVMISNTWHRRWYFQPKDSPGNIHLQFTVIEGIGCPFNDLRYPLMPPAIEPVCELCSFVQQGNLLYGTAMACKAAIADPGKNGQSVTIPSPCSPTDELHFSNPAQKGKLIFYNTDGRQLSVINFSGNRLRPGDYLYMPVFIFTGSPIKADRSFIAVFFFVRKQSKKRPAGANTCQAAYHITL